MDTLFPEIIDAEDLPAGCRLVNIAVAVDVWGPFCYAWPEDFGPPLRGQRVYVPFGAGSRKTPGFVVDVDGKLPPGIKLKRVIEVVDTQPQISDVMLSLASWISEYYLTPVGLVLAAAVPQVVGTAAPKREMYVLLDSSPQQWPANLGSCQRKALDELYEAQKQGVESLPATQLRRCSNISSHSLGKLAERSLIKTELREVSITTPEGDQSLPSPPFELNPDQD